jgi:NAD(P)H-nitrite reductase large subunit
VDTASKENYKVCNCNNVTYFDILDAIQNHAKMNDLLSLFEDVKNTTKCTTGCGGCYDKVIKIISDVMANGEAQ